MVSCKPGTLRHQDVLLCQVCCGQVRAPTRCAAREQGHQPGVLHQSKGKNQLSALPDRSRRAGPGAQRKKTQSDVGSIEQVGACCVQCPFTAQSWTALCPSTPLGADQAQEFGRRDVGTFLVPATAMDIIASSAAAAGRGVKRVAAAPRRSSDVRATSAATSKPLHRADRDVAAATPLAAHAVHGEGEPNDPSAAGSTEPFPGEEFRDLEVHSLTCELEAQYDRVSILGKRVARLEAAIQKYLDAADECTQNIRFQVDLQSTHTRILRRALANPY